MLAFVFVFVFYILDLSADAGRLHGQPLLPHPRVNPLSVHSLPQQGFCLHQHGNSQNDPRDTFFIRFLHNYCHHLICLYLSIYLSNLAFNLSLKPPSIFGEPVYLYFLGVFGGRGELQLSARLSSPCLHHLACAQGDLCLCIYIYFCICICICLIKSSEMISVDIWCNPWYLCSDGEEAEYSWEALDN